MKLQKSSVCTSREDAQHIIEQLREEYGDQASNLHEANEAKTRLLLVNRVLRALGWSDDDFNPETPTGPLGYTDYLLSIEAIPHLIVEAKRVGQTFVRSRHRLHRTEYPLRYLRTSFGPALTEILDQAERYAYETRVPFAALTNGAEWMIVQLLPSAGYASINDLRGYYFGNLFSDEFYLEGLWELLYKPYVAEGVLEENFAQLNSREVDYSNTPRAQFGALRWRRPDDAQELWRFYDSFFDEITAETRREMLEKCFVTNTELRKYQGELKRTLEDTAPGFVSEAVEISPSDRDALLTLESGDEKGRVILVTGSVGCGKSTLVTKVIVEANKSGTLIPLLVDFRNEDPDLRDAISVIWNSLFLQWKKQVPSSCHNEQLRDIFADELSDLKRGPYAKIFENDKAAFEKHEAELLQSLSDTPEVFMRRCWEHYQRRQKGIVVFFDNCDQASEHLQKQVYNFAHKIAQETGATSVITMREATFFRLQDDGFLTVRSSDRVFHLRTPDLEDLLLKRIIYVERYLCDDPRMKEWPESFPEMAQKHANTLKTTFLSRQSTTKTLDLLAAISWHDVRFF
jgi:RecA/RadA recombinase